MARGLVDITSKLDRGVGYALGVLPLKPREPHINKCDRDAFTHVTSLKISLHPAMAKCAVASF